MSSNLARVYRFPDDSATWDPPRTGKPASALSDDELEILMFRIEEFRARDEMHRCFMAAASDGVPLADC